MRAYSNENAVQQVVAASSFMTLATTDGNKPWACALFFGVDDEYNFYFVSSPDTVHARNINKNPIVSFAIYHPDSVPGGANGIQVSGTCRRVFGDELRHGLEVTYAKRFPDNPELVRENLDVEKFSGQNEDANSEQLYKIIPERIYFLDKSIAESARTEVFLSELQ